MAYDVIYLKKREDKYRCFGVFRPRYGNINDDDLTDLCRPGWWLFKGAHNKKTPSVSGRGYIERRFGYSFTMIILKGTLMMAW